jgi:hypothetical protein
VRSPLFTSGRSHGLPHVERELLGATPSMASPTGAPTAANALMGVVVGQPNLR